MTPTNDPAGLLRLMIHTQLAAGMIAPAFSEQALLAVNALAASSQAAQRVAALGQAMSPSAPVAQAPTLEHAAKGDSAARRFHYSNHGRRPEVRESAAERRAREQAEAIGYPRGRAA